MKLVLGDLYKLAEVIFLNLECHETPVDIEHGSQPAGKLPKLGNGGLSTWVMAVFFLLVF